MAPGSGLRFLSSSFQDQMISILTPDFTLWIKLCPSAYAMLLAPLFHISQIFSDFCQYLREFSYACGFPTKYVSILCLVHIVVYLFNHDHVFLILFFHYQFFGVSNQGQEDYGTNSSYIFFPTFLLVKTNFSHIYSYS